MQSREASKKIFGALGKKFFCALDGKPLAAIGASAARRKAYNAALGLSLGGRKTGFKTPFEAFLQKIRCLRKKKIFSALWRRFRGDLACDFENARA